MANKLRAFGYARVSVDEEGENNASIASQIAAIQLHCSRKNIELINIFVEAGVSGAKTVRKQFDLMIASAIAPDRPVDTIIVFALSRFARRMITQLVNEAMLADVGVDVHSLTETFANDATGKMMRGVVGLFNEKYANDAAVFTRRDRRQNASRGFFNGGNVTFGYASRTVQIDGKKERKKLFIVDDEAAVVRKIYDMAEVGIGLGPMGTRSIAKWLHAHGYTLRGKHFFHGSIDRILLQSQYTGKYLDNTKDDAGRLPTVEDQIEVSCPRIIDPDQAARVAALRARRAPAVTAPRIVNSPTLLTGLAACGMPGCAAGMTISTGKGGRYSYYKCSAKVNGGANRCTCPTLPMAALDNIVLEAVAERVLQPDRLTALLSGILDASETADTQRQEDLVQARKALTRSETAIGRLLELIEEGLMSAKDPIFAQRLAEKRGKKAQLSTTIASLERQMSRGSKKITAETVSRFGDMITRKLQGDDPVLRRAYVRLLVDKVEVTPTEIRILGSKTALEHAVLDDRVAAGRVPSFDREWCPKQDVSDNYVLPLLLR